MRKRILVFAAGCLLASLAWCQDQKSSSNSDATSGHEMANMPGMSMESAGSAMHAMQGHHMNMGPHMKMTALREPQSGDEQRAQQIVQAARKVAGKYRDYQTALADGFKIFLPNVPQKQYHFTNYSDLPPIFSPEIMRLSPVFVRPIPAL